MKPVRRSHDDSQPNDRRRTGSLEALFEASPLPQVVLAVQGTALLKANRAFQALTGTSASGEEALDRLFPHADQRKLFFDELQHKGVVTDQQWEVEGADGRRHWLVFSGVLTRWEGHEAALLSLVDLSAQKKAEDELRRTNAWQEALLGGTPDPVVYSDAGGVISGYNQAFRRVTGLTGQEWIGEHLSVFFPKDRLELLLQPDSILSRADLEFSFGQNRHIPIEYLVSRGRVKSPDARGEGWVFILKDITELKVVERQLKERDRLFQGLAQASGALLRLQGRTEAIHQALDSLGRSLEIRRIFLFRVGADKKTGVEEAILEETWTADDQDFLLAYKGQAVELARFGPGFLAQLNSGLPLNFEMNLVTDPELKTIAGDAGLTHALLLPLVMENRVWGFLALELPEGNRAWTQNERLILSGFGTTLGSFIRQTELAAQDRESRAYLSAVINNVAGNIWAVDTNYFYTVLNSSFHDVFLQTHDHDLQVGDNAAALMSDEDDSDFWLPLYSLAFAGEKVTVERTYPNGTFEQSISPIVQQDGKISGAVVFSKDITTRISTEEELRKAKEAAEAANRAKSEFLANMSHEIRTPLNIVLGFADILGNTLTDPIQKNYVESIRTSGKNLLLIINDILDLSKIEAGKMKLEKSFTDIKAVTDEVLRIFSLKASENNIALRLNANFEDRRLFNVDEVRFRQILFNLVGNAVKFTPSGSIEVSLESSEAEDDGLINLQIAVRDTGIGIKESAIGFIFDSFRQQDNDTTKKYGGTGLGLSITKRLVHMMDGLITVVSQEGVGTTFTVTLHRIETRSPATSKVVPQVRERVSFRGARILVVEDNDVNRLVLKEILRHNDVQIFEAENGLAALELLESQPVDLILMDIRMAKMDGYETASRLNSRSDWAWIPLIALTALAGTEDRERILQASFDAYLSKPIDQKRLLATLCEYLPFDRIPVAEPAGPRPVQPAATATPVHRPDQLQALEVRFAEQLQLAMKSGNLGKMEKAVQSLAEWAQAEHLPFWEEWSGRVLTSLKAFDLSTVESSLAEFPQLLSELKKQHAKESQP